MDERAVLAGPVDTDAARHRLEQPGGGTPSPGVRAEARGTPVAHDPPRVEDGAPVALAVGVPALGVVLATGERLVEDEPLGVGRVELGGRVVDSETGPTPEHAADVEGGGPLLVGASAARRRKEPHARPPAGAGAVRHGFAEIGHMVRVRQEAVVAAAKQPDLERVKADGAAPRGAGALVQDDRPGEAVTVPVRDEHLEARVRLVASGEGADLLERGHSGAAEVAEGARMRAVLVPEGAVVAWVTGRVPRRPAPVAPPHDVAVMHPLRAHRRAVRRPRDVVVDGIGPGQSRRGCDEQRRDREQQRQHEREGLQGGRPSQGRRGATA
jgi:hypothetical protein